MVKTAWICPKTACICPKNPGFVLKKHLFVLNQNTATRSLYGQPFATSSKFTCSFLSHYYTSTTVAKTCFNWALRSEPTLTYGGKVFVENALVLGLCNQDGWVTGCSKSLSCVVWISEAAKEYTHSRLFICLFAYLVFQTKTNNQVLLLFVNIF